MINKYLIAIFTFVTVYCSAQSNLSLLSNEYNSFFTEIDGELWISSASKGYNRYRGIDTKHYTLNDSSGLKGTYIQSPIFKDSQGLLWTSTYEYLCIFDKKKDKFHSFQLVINKDTVKTGYRIFHYDLKSNHVYTRVGEQSVIIDAKSKSILEILGPTKGNEFAINENTIIGSPWQNDKGIEIWKKKENRWIRSHEYFKECDILKKASITKSFYTCDTWWLLTTIGLVEFNENLPCASKLYTFHKEPANNAMTDGCQKGNYIFVGSDKNGVQIFDVEDRKFINQQEENEKVDYVFVDSFDQVWSSNMNEHIKVRHLNSFLFKRNTFENGQWNNIIQCGKKKILLDKENGFIVMDNMETYKINTSSPSCPFPNIHSITSINDHEVILAGLQELGTYDLFTKKYKKLNLKDIVGIQSVYYKDGHLYLCSGNKIFSYDTKTWQLKDNLALKPYQGSLQKTHYVSDLVHLYSASSSQLLIQNGNAIQTVDLSAFINDAIYISEHKITIVATNNGLKIINHKLEVNNAFALHPILNKEAVYRVERSGNFIYFNTERLLGRLKIDDLSAQILSQIFVNRPDFLVDLDKIHIASDHYYFLSLDDAFNTKHQPLLKMDAVKVNDKPSDIEALSSLHFKQNNITLRYFISDIQYPDDAMIQYKLKGIDQDWKTTKNGGEISFANLAPGTYTLKVKGINAFGIESSEVEQSFYIQSPWYKSAWFFILCTSILAFSLISWYRFNLNKINEKHNTTLQISNLQRSALQAQMNPHFIFNCLNSIQNFIMQNEKLEAMDYLNRFANLIRQNLDASTSNTILLSDELDMLKNYIELEQMRFNHAFDYAINIGDKLDIVSTYIPPLLIQPFVENAILHGVAGIEERGKIQIDISKVHQYLYIHIIDNGRGITDNQKDKMHKSHAMKITSQRLDYINSAKDKLYNINTTSSEKGTHITISVYLPDVVKS